MGSQHSGGWGGRASWVYSHPGLHSEFKDSMNYTPASKNEQHRTALLLQTWSPCVRLTFAVVKSEALAGSQQGSAGTVRPWLTHLEISRLYIKICALDCQPEVSLLKRSPSKYTWSALSWNQSLSKINIIRKTVHLAQGNIKRLKNPLKKKKVIVIVFVCYLSETNCRVGFSVYLGFLFLGFGFFEMRSHYVF